MQTKKSASSLKNAWIVSRILKQANTGSHQSEELGETWDGHTPDRCHLSVKKDPVSNYAPSNSGVGSVGRPLLLVHQQSTMTYQKPSPDPILWKRHEIQIGLDCDQPIATVCSRDSYPLSRSYNSEKGTNLQRRNPIHRHRHQRSNEKSASKPRHNPALGPTKPENAPKVSWKETFPPVALVSSMDE